VTLAELQAAWVRRQRWVAQMQAMAVARMFSGSSFDGLRTTGGVVVGASGKRYQEVPASAMLARFKEV